MEHISIAAEKIFEIAGLPITNSLLSTYLVMLFLVLLAVLVRRRLRFIPTKLQSVMEMMIDGIWGLAKGVSESFAHEFFPLTMTIFLFVLFSNWMGLLPGLSAFTVKHFIDGQEVATPILRASTADLNTTLALALISMVMVQYYGIKHAGFKIHFGKFFNFKGPIDFFVGILELVSEFSKIISFAFRLFGNVFAGEILLAVITSLIPLVVPLPFIGLEIFVGFIQAVVFSVLTMVFISSALEVHHE